MTKFDQLAQDLVDRKLTLRDLDIAVMVYIHKHPTLPEGVKNLLAVSGGGGLVRTHFQQIIQLIGNMELAYRRGIQEGQEDKPKKKKYKVK